MGEYFWPVLMLAGLIAGIFSGYPVAFILAGTGVIFAVLADVPMLFLSMGVQRIYSGTLTNWLLVAIPLLFTLAGLATWIPAFFQRSYGVTIEEFSRSGGAFLGFGLIIGTFAGGFIVNKLVARDTRWEFWWSALSCSLAVVPFMAVLMGRDVQVAYYGLFGAFFLAGTGFGPAMACMHTVSKQSVRATAVALMMFASSLIAYGAVPAVVGVLSDLFASFGAGVDDGTSLKYALLCSMTLPPVASILFLLASQRALPAATMSWVKHST